MSNKFFSETGFISPRLLLALSLCSVGGVMGVFGIAGIPWQHAPLNDSASSASRPPRYMPVRGEKGEDLSRMEQEWNDRLTYPTGRFNPAWLRQAAAQDAKIRRNIPLGAAATRSLKNLNGASIAGATVATTSLDPTRFTALGPAPIQMTGCSGCYDYTKTQGRVNTIVVDPTTTNDGTIVAYLGSDGGGVWKTTNCCSSGTTWNVTTDDPLLSTIAIDTLTIDPNDHNTIYAGTGDLNYGSF